MLKRYPAPVLKTYWPFFIAGAVVYYAVGKVTESALRSDEYINDPRNPRFKRGEKPVDLSKKD